MTTHTNDVNDLPPDVRDRATLAAEDAWLCTPDSTTDDWRAVVDAVTAVVAPEIARPLQARIEELEVLAEMWESRAKEVDAHRRALWDITGRDPKVWSEAHARAVLAKGEKPGGLE